MDNQPVLYDGLRTILHHMDANLRINMSLQMPSIHAIEKSVPLKIRYLRITDTTVEVNDVRYKLGVYRDYPNGDIPEFVKIGNARGGVETDFDRFGFEIPIGSNPILPGDVSVRNGDELVVRSDTDELEEHYQTELKRCENDLRFYAKKESGIETKLDDAWLTRSPVYRGKDEEELQEMAEEFREKLKPFHCRRQNLPRPFNCYIQLSSMNDGDAKPLQRLVYNRKLYGAVKQFYHILFANRPVIQLNKLVCLANDVYRIPGRLKIKANMLDVRRSQIASIAKILEGDVNILTVFKWGNEENWWQHRLVKNAKELITECSPLMLRNSENKIIRFHNPGVLRTEEYCELIDSWMSVKREPGAELWIGLYFKKHRNDILEMMQTRMEVVGLEERCVRMRAENGGQIEVFEEVCLDKTMAHRLAVKVKIIEN